MQKIKTFFTIIKLLLSKDTRASIIWSLRGNEKLKYEHNLDKNSLVLDIGGYTGDFAKTISDRYECKIQIYEPVNHFAEECKNLFSTNSKITINNYGLSSVEGFLDFYLADNASGFDILREEKSLMKVLVKSVSDEFRKFDSIDLVKINIEGAEYDLLFKLIKDGLLGKPKSYLIQFHNFYSDSVINRKIIHNELQKDFSLKWNYSFVWELWTRV